MNSWYETLNKPVLTPPNWVFGVVWSLLYVMITASIVLFVKASWNKATVWTYILIGMHLCFNFIWTTLFFKLQLPGLALVDIVVLDVTLVVMFLTFWKVNSIAGALLIPYLVWVLFATYLNAAFYVLNKT